MEWKPKGWITLLLGILLPPFAFLYVNQGTLFWRYFLLSLVVAVLDYVLHKSIPPSHWLNYVYLNWLFTLVCAVHAYLLCRAYSTQKVRRWYAKWWAIPAIFTIFYSLVFLFRAFCYEPFSIPATSMNPTLKVGEYIIVKKWGFGDYGSYGVTLNNTQVKDESMLQRGEIYVFYPPDSETPYVKRLIGLPGDTIVIEGDVITVNGKVLRTEFLRVDDDNKIYREFLGDKNYLIQRNPNRPVGVFQTVEVPAHHYFFLGDNRDNSRDSRFWGTVSTADFVGEVAMVLAL
ncbi:hypothetical protein GCM10011338_08270 [Alteromonas lipolytica]|uniref:Signal peptidase I n=2 Tax=Alteromonas lipolytica TaxID=1856405 RepID=A0A1E8FH73_9ALTE|nr:signal peptidase I [Alteromonas lipolytica]GGF58343.1 hypothetical protein GCM10011338_08270 [Alteromonas lipolytica]